MAYLYDQLPFLEGGRRTALWTDARSDDPAEDHLVAGHHLYLPTDQHVSLEDDFLTSHLPLFICGFGGVAVDGRPWLVVLQQASPVTHLSRADSADAYWPMRESLNRALSLNPGARVTTELRWKRAGLIDVYEQRGVPALLLAQWPVGHLVKGLLAESCDVALPDIAAGYATGCAFPDHHHGCAGDVFSDVFQERVGRVET